ncbi:hypothetical protein [uncultured Pseudomonas sp.]|uniref:hypothetical protein n=1 Tax=uncultured Pseudomonas sp. TaxID=114707 RepID=UPI0025EAFF03|nr:hypothetical protein [uncultured Pseudomonas sp.]
MPSPLSPFYTLVIRMPESQEARAALTGDVKVLIKMHGGEVTGRAQGDEMTLCERFEAALPDWQAEEIRQEVEALALQPQPAEREAR